jgi:hypothetical protein
VYNSQYQSTAAFVKDVETVVQNCLGVVEGAFCTAKSILSDFFGMGPIIDNSNYPFISSSE